MNHEDALLRLKNFSPKILFHTVITIAIEQIQSFSIYTNKNSDPDTWKYVIRFGHLDLVSFSSDHKGDYAYLVTRLASIWEISESKALSKYLRLLNKTARHDYSLEKRIRLHRKRLEKNALRHSR